MERGSSVPHFPNKTGPLLLLTKVPLQPIAAWGANSLGGGVSGGKQHLGGGRSQALPIRVGSPCLLFSAQNKPSSPPSPPRGWISLALPERECPPSSALAERGEEEPFPGRCPTGSACPETARAGGEMKVTVFPTRSGQGRGMERQAGKSPIENPSTVWGGGGEAATPMTTATWRHTYKNIEKIWGGGGGLAAPINPCHAPPPKGESGGRSLPLR